MVPNEFLKNIRVVQTMAEFKKKSTCNNSVQVKHLQHQHLLLVHIHTELLEQNSSHKNKNVALLLSHFMVIIDLRFNLFDGHSEKSLDLV